MRGMTYTHPVTDTDSSFVTDTRESTSTHAYIPHPAHHTLVLYPASVILHLVPRTRRLASHALRDFHHVLPPVVRHRASSSPELTVQSVQSVQTAQSEIPKLLNEISSVAGSQEWGVRTML